METENKINWGQIAGGLFSAGTGQNVIQAEPTSLAEKLNEKKQDNTLLYIAIFAGLLMFAGLFYLISR